MHEVDYRIELIPCFYSTGNLPMFQPLAAAACFDRRSFYISIGQDLPIFIVVILHDVGIMTNHQAQSIVVSPLILLGSLLFFIFGYVL